MMNTQEKIILNNIMKHYKNSVSTGFKIIVNRIQNLQKRNSARLQALLLNLLLIQDLNVS